ncbi:hypothetical protein C8R43DRAFT_1012218 [Mycena crocata]|nr:hypothetical protein C8R43DRAFT_1012218 [Mycena crocata]
MSLVQSLAVFDTPRSSNDISERSSERTYTDTSSVWGPGTLSGRALLALGEVTLRGIDSFLIRRKLAAIQQRGPDNLTSLMCSDLVELCRPAMYSVGIVKKAIQVTLTQICAGPELSVYMIVVFLCKWSRQEARLILFELIRHFCALSRPPGWRLERLYDFLTAVVQVKEGWRSFVVEAATLLDSAVQPLILHPIHVLCAETTGSVADLVPLSSIQSAHAAHMRLNTWLFLQTCGLPLEARMLKIEKILQETPDLSTTQTIDAIADIGIFLGSQFGEYFDSGIKSAASNCLQDLVRTCIENMWSDKRFQDTSASMLPPKARNADRELQENAVESLKALVFLRRAASQLTDDMFDDLLVLCLQTANVAKIVASVAVSLTLWALYAGPEYHRLQCALSLCKLTREQMRQILKALVNDVPSLSNHLDAPSAFLACRVLCDFLALVLQITGPEEYMSKDIATALLALAPMAGHPILTLGSEIVEEREISPFSMLQLNQFSGDRFKNWKELQKLGLRLETRMAQIQHILTQTSNPSNFQSFDAIADAIIFKRDFFTSELRSSASECLFN